MGSAPLKRWLHFVGGGLGLAGVVFVGIRLYQHIEEIDLTRFDFATWIILGLLVLIYGAANTLLARAWWRQLELFDLRTEWRWALSAYGQSQLAKYIPGNIFHLAGRQALGMAAGLPARPLAKSAAWELGSIAVAGACFGLLTLPLVWPAFSQPTASLLFLCLLSALYFSAARWCARAAAVGLLWQTAFLTISGAVFIITLGLVTDDVHLITLAPALCGAYVVAWLAGLITPGAPAGVGIRELALLFFLQDHVEPEALLLAVVLARVITVVGDFLFFGAMIHDRNAHSTLAQNGKK